MSAYQHKRNFSLLATQSQTSAKLKSTNRSLRKIQNNNGNNHSWLLVAARQYYHKTNNLPSAIQSFQQYLSHNPSHQQSLYLCSICYMHSHQYQKAIIKLKQYLHEKKQYTSSSLNPTSTSINNRKLIIHSYQQLPQINHAYLLLSIAYNKINNVSKAMETINDVLKIDGKYEQGFCFRAKMYVQMGDFEKACFDYKQVLKNNQACLEAWIGLGDYYTQTNNYQQAYKCYTKAKQCSKESRTQAQPQQYEIKRVPQKQVSRYNNQKSSAKQEQRKTQRMHQKLSQFLKRPKRVSQFPITVQKQGAQNTKIKPKLNIRTVTSPSHQTNIMQYDRQQYGRKQKLFFGHNFTTSNNHTPTNNAQSAVQCHKLAGLQQPQLSKQIDLKMSICLYYLGEHNKSLQLLQPLKQQKQQSPTNYSSQIYYYLAANQLKQYQQAKSQMNKYPQISQNKVCAQLLERVILNLQTSIKAGNNIKVMTKSCKTLIRLYIQNSQFYQTGAVVQLAHKYGIDVKEYQVLSQACMLVIKQKYQQALPILKRLLQSVMANTNQNRTHNIPQSQTSGKLTQLQISTRSKNKQKQKQSQRQRQKQKCSSMRLSTNKNKQHTLSFNVNQRSNKKSRVQQIGKYEIELGEEDERQDLIVSTGNDRKISKRNTQPYMEDQCSNQFKNLHLRNLLHTPKHNTVAMGTSPQQSNQLQWMIPTILLFRAYSQYFSDNFIQCLQVYEHYENYIKDYLGKQPQTDIYLSYNKVMCEGILMIDNQMIEESIEKFVICVENYYKLLKGVAVQPILFRILALIRLALSQNPFISEQINTRSKIYLLIIEIIDHYLPAISNNPLVYYYYGLALYELERYKEASDFLEKCLKIAEQCTWKFLYVKGAIEIKNKIYKDAVRQFSAGLLVDEKAQLYLGRCICYIHLFDQSHCQQQTLMQKSFEDLQKFIQLEDNKQKISKWVTKILFFNKAYEEVSKSIKKVSSQTLENDEDMAKIQKSLNIYNGAFQDGGVLGQVIINAFQGKFEDTSVQINGQRHQIILSDFVSSKYKKWLHILNLYSAQRYSQLIKYLQVSIFQEKSEEDALQLRYNLAIVYYLSQESSKADNVLAGLTKHVAQIHARVQKFLNRDFMLDQCVDDLKNQLKGIKRLSSFLPYRKVALSSKVLLSSEPPKTIYVRISMPFPEFFKPNIDLDLDQAFIYGETAQTCIPKRIQAPWIKRVTGHVQFTDNLISSHNTSIFDQDVLSAAVESKEESESMPSSIKNL